MFFLLAVEHRAGFAPGEVLCWACVATAREQIRNGASLVFFSSEPLVSGNEFCAIGNGLPKPKAREVISSWRGLLAFVFAAIHQRAMSRTIFTSNP